MTPEVLVIGRSCVDHLAVVDRFPSENEKAPILTRMIEAGGQGGTAACCISRLGGSVAYVGTLGDGDGGRFCLQRLSDFGVDTGHVRIIPGGRTPEAYVFVTKDTGHRTILYEKNALPRIRITDIPDRLLTSARVVLLDPETTYLIGELRRALPDGARLVYDAERWREGMAEVMAAVDYFIPGAEFLDDSRLGLTATTRLEKARELQGRIGGKLIVTLGEQGALFMDRDRPYRMPAPEVPVRDTVGAGDNFHAAFALAVSRGEALPSAVALAVAVASLSCREYGGRNGVPEMTEAAALATTLAAVPTETR